MSARDDATGPRIDAPGHAEASAATAWVRAVAPAKVNLRLDVLGRRRDGFHELATAMLALDLVDDVLLRPRGDRRVTLAVDGPAASDDVPLDGRNLAWRAAVAALELGAAGGSCAADVGFDLRLTKRIPSRAGLGGGSSDAAAAVLAVEAAFGFTLSGAQRAELLAELGSDVPFFGVARASGYAWCFGRGEDVRPLDLPRDRVFWFTLVVPTVEAPTAAVYGALGLPPGSVVESQRIEDLLAEPTEDLRGAISNGLERAALDALPELMRWRAMLDAVEPGAYQLCGSGSGWFAPQPDEAAARAGAAAVERAAGEAGLGLRLATVARAAGHGATVREQSNDLRSEA